MKTGSSPTDIYSQLCLDYGPKRSRLQIWYRLIACHVYSTRSISRFLKARCNLSLPGYDILTVVARHPDGISMTQLARLLMVGNSNITGITARLEQAGLLERSVTHDDKRGRIVKFTRKGKTFWKKAHREYQAFVEQLLGDIKPVDRAEIDRALSLMQQYIAASERRTRG